MKSQQPNNMRRFIRWPPASRNIASRQHNGCMLTKSSMAQEVWGDDISYQHVRVQTSICLYTSNIFLIRSRQVATMTISLVNNSTQGTTILNSLDKAWSMVMKRWQSSERHLPHFKLLVLLRTSSYSAMGAVVLSLHKPGMGQTQNCIWYTSTSQESE